MNRFWSNYIKQSPLSFLVLLIVGCLIPLSPFPWDNYQFILAALVPIGYFIYLLVSQKEKVSIQLVSSDIAWFLFVSMGLFSYGWSINGSLVWNEFFGWSVLLLWMLVFRSLCEEAQVVQNLEQLLLGLFLCFIIQSVLFFGVYSSVFNSSLILEKIAELLNIELTNFLDKDIYRWHKFFGYNANVVALHILSLYPFLLFYKSKTFLFSLLKWGCGIWLLFLIYKAGSQGVLFAFILLLLYYIWVTCRPKFFLSTLSITFACLLFIGYWVISNSISPLLDSFTNPGSLGNRIHPIVNSIRVWWESPIFGYGLGNWHLIAFKYDNLDLGEFYQSVDPLKGIINYRLLQSHNLYSKHLVELGMVGLAAFLYPFGVVLWKCCKNPLGLTAFQKALGGLVIVYLCAAFFYRNANFFPNYFSRIQFLVFCALGILTSTNYQKYRLPTYIYPVFFIVAVGSFSWFVYGQLTNHRYKLAVETLEENPTVGIQKIEALLHPVFKTTHQGGESLTLHLAKLYTNQKAYDFAEKYYALSLKSAPFNEEVLSNFAIFLLKTGRDIPKAKKYAQKVLTTNNRYQFEMLFTLAEIAILERDYEKARYYLNERYHNYLKHPHRHRIMLLEKELYFGNKTYLNQLVNLTTSQKNEVEQLSARYGIEDTSIKAQLERFKYTSTNNEKIRNEDVLMARALAKLLTEEQFQQYSKDKLGLH